MYNIDRAVAFLSEAGRVDAVSRPFTSRAWGFDSDSDFVNVGVNLETELSPVDLLEAVKRIERQIAPGESHRDFEGRYADRTIDLDIIAYGDVVVESADLTVPHPLMGEREFVLRPLIDLMPEWRHPITGKTSAEMLEIIQ